MKFIDELNKWLGVEPPNFRKRIIIGSTAITIVTIISAIVLVAWVGSYTMIEFFGIKFYPIKDIKYIVKIITILIVLFSISIIYYIILPTKKEKRKQPIYGQYIWTLKEKF